jgi:hypothetical protein
MSNAILDPPFTRLKVVAEKDSITFTVRPPGLCAAVVVLAIFGALSGGASVCFLLLAWPPPTIAGMVILLIVCAFLLALSLILWAAAAVIATSRAILVLAEGVLTVRQRTCFQSQSHSFRWLDINRIYDTHKVVQTSSAPMVVQGVMIRPPSSARAVRVLRIDVTDSPGLSLSSHGLDVEWEWLAAALTYALGERLAPVYEAAADEDRAAAWRQRQKEAEAQMTSLKAVAARIRDPGGWRRLGWYYLLVLIMVCVLTVRSSKAEHTTGKPDLGKATTGAILGAFFALAMIPGVKSGSAIGFRSDEHPVVFWFLLAICGLVTAMCFGTAIDEWLWWYRL